MAEGELKLCLPSPIFGRGAGGEGKDLSLHWDALVTAIAPSKVSDSQIEAEYTDADTWTY
jgi:hypothetical protein